MYLMVSYKKKIWKKIFLFASIKLLKKGDGSGSISQRYRSADPDPHQYVTDPRHCGLSLTWTMGSTEVTERQTHSSMLKVMKNSCSFTFKGDVSRNRKENEAGNKNLNSTFTPT
jgi:hypothetical protein